MSTSIQKHEQSVKTYRRYQNGDTKIDANDFFIGQCEDYINLHDNRPDRKKKDWKKTKYKYFALEP